MDINAFLQFYKDSLGNSFDEKIFTNLVNQYKKNHGTAAEIIINNGAIHNHSNDNTNYLEEIKRLQFQVKQLTTENNILKAHINHLRDYIEEIETTTNFLNK